MIEGLKPYLEYKESGLPWLKAFPSHWVIKRGKSYLFCIDERSKDGKEELLTVSSARGVIPRNSAKVTMFKAESYAGHKLCWPGDLVINSLWAWGGGLGVAQHHGIISTAYSVYRSRPSAQINPRYLHELVRSSAFHWELQVRSKGVWISRLQLTDTSFLDAPIPLPPPSEQLAIIRFLDHANRKIDGFIRAKRKLIGLLNEQKQAIIHRAVTRGLDPNAKLKPSGIPWLGEIPEHWDVRQVKRVASFVTSGSRGWADYYSDDGLVFIQSGNLGRNMALNFSRTQYVRPPSGAEGERTRVDFNDILVCITGALTGNVVHVDQQLPGPSFINQHVALVRPRTGIVFPRFLAYALRSETGQSQFKTSEYGGTKQGLGLGDVKDVFFPLPSMAEQKAIVEHVDSSLDVFTTAIARTEREIALMHEYRTRLTADIVTGKLDVREAAAKLPEEKPAEVVEADLFENETEQEEIES